MTTTTDNADVQPDKLTWSSLLGGLNTSCKIRKHIHYLSSYRRFDKSQFWRYIFLYISALHLAIYLTCRETEILVMSIIQKHHGYRDGDLRCSFIQLWPISHAIFWKLRTLDRNNNFSEIVAKIWIGNN